MKPAQKKPLVEFLRAGFEASERRACQIIGLHRSVYRYASQAKDQTPLMMRIRDLAAARVPYDYRRIAILLRREGWRVNDKRFYRLYKQMDLSLRSKRAKKQGSGLLGALPVPTRPDKRWTWILWTMHSTTAAASAS